MHNQDTSREAEITVYFGPNKENDSIDICITYDPDTSSDEVESWDYEDGKFPFRAFNNTISSGEEYIAIHLPVPHFLSKKDKNPVDKFLFRGLFLIKPLGEDLIGKPGGDHGQHGCPSAGAGGGGKKLDGDNVSPVITVFTFNDNLFIPLILPNWQCFYHITEIHDFWNEFDPKKHKISVDYPIQYDTTFGIFYTREVSYDEEDKLRGRFKPGKTISPKQSLI